MIAIPMSSSMSVSPLSLCRRTVHLLRVVVRGAGRADAAGSGWREARYLRALRGEEIFAASVVLPSTVRYWLTWLKRFSPKPFRSGRGRIRVAGSALLARFAGGGNLRGERRLAVDGQILADLVEALLTEAFDLHQIGRFVQGARLGAGLDARL